CQVDKLTNNAPPVATLAVAPTTLRLAAAVGSAALRTDSVNLKNGGEGALARSAATAHGAAWLSLNPRSGSTPGWLHGQPAPVRAGDSGSIVMSAPILDGYVVLDTATTSDTPPLAQNDQCVAGPGACLLYQVLRAAGPYTIEATSGPPAATGLFTLSVTRPRPPAAPDALAQLTSDGVTVMVGGNVDQPSVVLRGTVSDPDVGDTLRLQVEALPVSTAFTGTPTAVSDRT